MPEPAPRAIRAEPPPRIRRRRSPWLVLIGTLAALIGAGTLLLALPFATEAGERTTPLEALFTATSAVSVTGLAVADTATRWSVFGEVVILILVQMGGFAFMTGSTLILLALVGGRTSLEDRLRVQAAGGLTDLSNVGGIVRRVALFTLACEAAGALLLAAAFLIRGEAPVTAAWWGIFHAVSAFNNAGFDLFGGARSLTHLADVPAIIVPIGLLIVLGSTGYAIVADVVAKRRWVRLALETKIVMVGTLVLVVGGAAATAALEWSNPATLGRLETGDRLLNAVFHSVTLRSAGYDSLGVGGMLDETLILGIVLMFIGGASGSTAGGIRINTVAVLLVASLSAARGMAAATAFNRRIPHIVVYRAVAVLLVALAGALVLSVLLRLSETPPLLGLLFEGVSALSTAGVSAVGTDTLTPTGQLLLTAAMFAGRLGPLALVLAFTVRSRPARFQPAVETIRIS